MTKNIKLTSVSVADLKHLPTKNPNVMDPNEYEALVAGIKKYGFLQPILVLEDRGSYVVVDGVHRAKAAAEIGLAQVPAVVAEDPHAAEILRIAMNKIRGQLDLTEVGRQLQQLLDTGVDENTLTLTGFASWEIEAMLETLSGVDEDELLAGASTTSAPAKEKFYTLSFKFDSDSKRVQVREALEKLGNGDPTQGLILAVASI